MKRLLKIGSIVLCCLFILSGCKKRDSKELVLNIYDTWQQMNMDVWIVGPAISESDLYPLGEDDEALYLKVNDDKFNSIMDIKSATEEVCTKNGAEKMFYNNYLTQSKIYCEEDGSLFRLQAEIPTNYGGELVNFKILEEKKDYIRSEMEFSDSELESDYTIDIILVMENGKWLVDNLVQKLN